MLRVSTGVSGLDQVMGGGLLERDLCVVAGPAGGGKTVLGCQYIFNAVSEGEKALYISFEEDPEQIKDNMKEIGWDFEPFEQQGLVSFEKHDPFHLDDLFGLIENQVRSMDAKRVVIDSVTGFTLNMSSDSETRTSIYRLSRLLKRLDCTTVMLAESPPSNRTEFTKFGVEEFVADNVIILFYYPVGPEFRRALTIWKMRGSWHSNKIHPYEIMQGGIVVYPEQEISLGE